MLSTSPIGTIHIHKAIAANNIGVLSLKNENAETRYTTENIVLELPKCFKHQKLIRFAFSL